MPRFALLWVGRCVKGVVALLVPLLERKPVQPDLLMVVVIFLRCARSGCSAIVLLGRRAFAPLACRKLSVFEENKDTMIEMRAVDKLAGFVPCRNDKLMLVRARVACVGFIVCGVSVCMR